MKEQKIIDRDELLLPYNMIKLYANGAFPMAEDDGEVNWYLPDTRTIIPLDNFNVPRSLKKFMDDCDFDYRYDLATMEVVKNCAKRKETWISTKLINAYKGLFEIGYLHSVEVYQKSKLVGGLYGVTYRGAFYGESMFSEVSQASKSALVKLIERLNERGFKLLDVQFQTEHLKMFGTVEIPFEDYMKLNAASFEYDVKF
ncbi:MAG: leucyl/phenylalanyl-tRNA--protein transferase [Ignavibacteria bacterium GWB2_35_6b]|nr:MAG: leucyl/phenylalanyl-tRNA--protein transferase [Ignavibacteria bacterium GWB2_35_6b]